MKNLTGVDGLLLFIGLVLGRIGSFVGGLVGPIILASWYQSDLFKLLVGGCFSIAGICLGKIVEVEWRERVRERKNRSIEKETDRNSERS
jgi:hypothetical protein